MKVIVKEPQQYRSTYQRLSFDDVVDLRQSKDGKYTTLIFADGGKSRRLTRLIESVQGCKLNHIFVGIKAEPSA